MGTQHILEYKISLGLWWCILSSRALHHENLALLLKQLLFLKNCFKKFYCKKKKKEKRGSVAYRNHYSYLFFSNRTVENTNSKETVT